MKFRNSALPVIWLTSIAVAWWVGQSMSGNSTPVATSQPASGPAKQRTQDTTTMTSVLTAAPKAETPPGFPSEKEVSYFRDTAIPIKDRVNKFLALEDPIERMTGYLELLKTLNTDEDMTTAMGEISKNFDGRRSGRELSMLVGLWAQRNPEAALAETTKLKDYSSRYGTDTALTVWTKANPDAAKAWAAAHNTDPKGTGEGNTNMISIISQLAKTDLDKAVAWAQAEPKSRARGEMMDRLVSNMTKQRGLDYSQNWSLGLPEGPFRDGVLRKVANEAIQTDPAKSAEWILNIPKGEAKQSAMNDLVDHWAEKDPNAAGQWLQKYTNNPEMDGPRRSFAWEIRERDPESAVAWAGAIQDQKQRGKMMVEVMRDWSRRDKNAAQTYMQRNSWPTETQSKVIR